MKRRHRQGKFAGFTATTIGRLMGCASYTAKRYLKAYMEFTKKTSEELTEDDIGKLIYDYRFKCEDRSLDKELRELRKLESQWQRNKGKRS